MMASHCGHYCWDCGGTVWNILQLTLDCSNGGKALQQAVLQIILSQCSSQFFPCLTCFHSFCGIRGFISPGMCCCVNRCVVAKCSKDCRGFACKGQGVQAPCRQRQRSPKDVTNHTPSNTSSYPSRPESSEAAVWEAQILASLKHSVVATWSYHQLAWLW
jgi:hypothetical protein